MLTQRQMEISRNTRRMRRRRRNETFNDMYNQAIVLRHRGALPSRISITRRSHIVIIERYHDMSTDPCQGT